LLVYKAGSWENGFPVFVPLTEFWGRPRASHRASLRCSSLSSQQTWWHFPSVHGRCKNSCVQIVIQSVSKVFRVVWTSERFLLSSWISDVLCYQLDSFETFYEHGLPAEGHFEASIWNVSCICI